jgi:RsiW-degrading membrane proteinase PrsW (M82 family)
MTPIKTLLLERLFIINKKTNLFDGHPHKITDWDWALNETEALLVKKRRSYKWNIWFIVFAFLLGFTAMGLAMYYKSPVHRMIMPLYIVFSATDRWLLKKHLIIALEEEVFLVKAIREIVSDEVVENAKVN